MTQHPLTLALVQILHAQGHDLAPHLKTAFEKLSPEHPSGISLEQMETPMMRQFKEAKDAVPDGLLFFRMGDFYELFGADAIIAAEVCQLTLTSRDRNSDNPVPMAGVPVVNHRVTLKKALAAGFKVAVCDQLEDPKLAKGLVKRDIVRIATPAVPGDLGDEDDSTSPAGTWLACAVPTPSAQWALAFVDVSTGTFRFTGRLSGTDLEQELATLLPKEIIVPAAQVERFTDFSRTHFSLIPRVSPLPAWILRSASDTLRLFEDFFPLTKLNVFGLPSIEGSIQAVGGILSYLKEAQRGVVKNLTRIDFYDVSKHLVLDDSTKRHLDFFMTSTGERKGSLFQFLNNCATPCGARLLAFKLNYPEKSKSVVENSLQSVETALRNSQFERELYNELKTFIDIERALGRAAQNAIDPKGLSWLGQTLSRLPGLLHLMNNLKEISAGWNDSASSLRSVLLSIDPLKNLLTRALEEEPANVVGKGGRIFKQGYHEELDELCDLESNFEEKISALELQERNTSGIPTLKIGYTRAFGYYFEISKGKLAQVPQHFERKQTLVNGERFITPELKELEEKAISASEKRTVIEKQLLEELKTEIIKNAESLTSISKLIAQIDVWRCFAQLAKENRWCKPILVDAKVTALQECVHPILAGLKTTQSKFISNDIVLGDTSSLTQDQFGFNLSRGQVLLVTGPNMAGKSTVMRQVALVQILAQMGCFVPAKNATLGLCDKIFTRIGSGDFALRNQSTFMVEMLETAQMLRFATPSSLLLLDEIGRGTSTYDGLSLAWAILEDLAARVGARALFSTHYHELVESAQQQRNVIPMRMEVIEQPSITGEQIIFTYRFLRGAAGKSYGIQVARLAGVPEHVVLRASEILKGLSAHDRNQSSTHQDHDNSRTTVEAPSLVQPEVKSNALEPLRAFLKEIDPAELSPRDALDLVYELVATARSSTNDSTQTSPVSKRTSRKKQWDTSVLPSLF